MRVYLLPPGSLRAPVRSAVIRGLLRPWVRALVSAGAGRRQARLQGRALQGGEGSVR